MAKVDKNYEIKVEYEGQVFSKKCKSEKCSTLIPDRRNYCSRSCASFVTSTNQHTNPQHTKSLSEKRKKLIEDNGGRIPFLEEYLKSGKNKENLTRTPERIAQQKAGMKKIVERGDHPFQRSEVRIKSAKALGQNKYSSFIERKVKWLLDQKGIEYTHNYTFERDVKFDKGTNRLYFIDFVLKDYKIAIEVDGEYWHRNKERDLMRQKEIEAKGFTVLRFPGEQVRNRLHECSQEIDKVLANKQNKAA